VTSKSRADAIYDRIRVIGGTVMPPTAKRREDSWQQISPRGNGTFHSAFNVPRNLGVADIPE
jgi:hypothetical protein